MVNSIQSIVVKTNMTKQIALLELYWLTKAPMVPSHDLAPRLGGGDLHHLLGRLCHSLPLGLEARTTGGATDGGHYGGYSYH